MTLLEIFANGIQPLLIEKPGNSPAFIRERVVSDINAAVQVMTTGIDYFTREAITLTINPGAPSVALPEDTLNAYGPMRLGDGSMLTPIETRGEFDQFPQLYLGYKGPAPAGRPVGIFIEKGNRTGADNSVIATARFSPSPGAAYSVQFDISRRPRTYTVADLSEPSPTVPVPHKMAESILLPLVRWNVRTSHFFNSPDMLPSMEQEYRAALSQLGLAEPTQSAATGDVLERKKQAARAAAREAYNNAQ